MLANRTSSFKFHSLELQSGTGIKKHLG